MSKAQTGRRIEVSFEFFPPNTEKMEARLWSAVERVDGCHESTFTSH